MLDEFPFSPKETYNKIMRHDILHCDGEGCPLKQTCERYLAYLEVRDTPNVPMLKKPDRDYGCEYYTECHG